MWLLPPSASATELTLGEARDLALSRDPGLSHWENRARATRSDALAAGQLPDPMLRLGAMNFPVDSFDRDQEPMTQLQLGIRQSFPAGDTLQYRRQALEVRADAQQALGRERARRVLREVSFAWIARLHAERLLELLADEDRDYGQLARTIESRLATGQTQQADLLGVTLEQQRVADQISAGRMMADKAAASLARWVGADAAARPTAASVGAADLLRGTAGIVQGPADLQRHPRYQAAGHQVGVEKARLQQAREAYAPAWGVDLAYGLRDGSNPDGSSRPDFASAMISVSLPLFPKTRQDMSLAARHADLLAAEDQQRGTLLELQESYERNRVRLVWLDERLKRFAEIILPQAEMRAEATLRAYRNDAGEFEAMLRARLTLQRALRDRLNLDTERLQALAEMEYLRGKGPTTGISQAGSDDE